MTDKRDWSSYQHWYELLDALCVEKGYLDNMHLADRLCSASGNSTQVAFETAVKNLRNWRHGVHTPQRRNFLLLGKILKVDRDSGLRRQWNAQYHQAKNKPGKETDQDLSPPIVKTARWKIPAMIGGIAGITGAALAAAFVSMPFKADSEAADQGFEGIAAGYLKFVTVKVGDAIIIHGASGNNCGPAPEWEATKKLLPELATGTLSDGGLGTRYSRQCNGRVAARAILFTATTPGTEKTSIYSDAVTINVQ